ncbi:hypothetical protein L195_g047556, partial [Trifolium pratense]
MRALRWLCRKRVCISNGEPVFGYQKAIGINGSLHNMGNTSIDFDRGKRATKASASTRKEKANPSKKRSRKAPV